MHNGMVDRSELTFPVYRWSAPIETMVDIKFWYFAITFFTDFNSIDLEQIMYLIFVKNKFFNRFKS